MEHVQDKFANNLLLVMVFIINCSLSCVRDIVCHCHWDNQSSFSGSAVTIIMMMDYFTLIKNEKKHDLDESLIVEDLLSLARSKS